MVQGLHIFKRFTSSIVLTKILIWSLAHFMILCKIVDFMIIEYDFMILEVEE